MLTNLTSSLTRDHSDIAISFQLIPSIIDGILLSITVQLCDGYGNALISCLQPNIYQLSPQDAIVIMNTAANTGDTFDVWFLNSAMPFLKIQFPDIFPS